MASASWNLTGYAAEFDIFNSNGCDGGNGDHAGIDTLAPCSTSTGIPNHVATSGDLFAMITASDKGVGDIGDGVWRTAKVQLSGGQLSVSITDPTTMAFIAVPSLQSVALPGFTSGTPYYIGFGGGTGSGSLAAKEEIRNVQVTFPSLHCL